jgi:hypothetical protein
LVLNFYQCIQLCSQADSGSHGDQEEKSKFNMARGGEGETSALEARTSSYVQAVESRRFGVEEVDAVVTTPPTSGEGAKGRVDGQTRQGVVTNDADLDGLLAFPAGEDDGIQYAHGNKSNSVNVGGSWAPPPPPSYLAEPLGLNPVRCIR